MKNFYLLLLVFLSFNMNYAKPSIGCESDQIKQLIFLPDLPNEIWNIIFQYLKGKKQEIRIYSNRNHSDLNNFYFVNKNFTKLLKGSIEYLIIKVARKKLTEKEDFEYIKKNYINLTILELSGSSGSFNIDFFKSINELNIRNLYCIYCKLKDNCFEYLGKLTKLQYLELENCECVTSTGFQYFSSLTNLESLKLLFNGISDYALSYLTAIKNLKYIRQSHSSIGYINSLTTLQDVNLEGYEHKIDLKNLSKLIGLKNLNLSCCRIIDKGLKDLSTLTNLENINLSFCFKITDDGIKNLIMLNKLKHINLACCKITNNGIKYLTSLTSLERIDLWGCKKITYEGLILLTSITGLHKIRLSRYRKFIKAREIFVNILKKDLFSSEESDDDSE